MDQALRSQCTKLLQCQPNVTATAVGQTHIQAGKQVKQFFSHCFSHFIPSLSRFLNWHHLSLLHTDPRLYLSSISPNTPNSRSWVLNAESLRVYTYFCQIYVHVLVNVSKVEHTKKKRNHSTPP